MRLVIFIWKTILYLPRNFYFKNRALSKIVLPLLRQRHRVAKKNIELCFANENKNTTSEILKNNELSLTQAIFDTGIAWFWDDDKINKIVKHKIHNIEILNQNSLGNLIIFKHSLHLELDARILGMHSEIYGVGRKNNSNYLEQVIKKGRLRGLKDTASNKEVKKFIKWLKNGKSVLYAIDQDYGKKQSLIQKFFGADVYVINVTDKIQAMTKCNIIFMNSFYDEDNMLHISLELVKPKGKKIVSSSEIHSIIEDSIRANPGEYLWHHRRFKSVLGKSFYK